MAHCAGADHRNGFNLFRTATWAAHLAENRAKASRSLGTTQIDYPNIRSYTIRSAEKAILSCLNGILNMNSSLCNLCVLCVSVVALLGKSHHRDTENTKVAQRSPNQIHYA